LGIIAEFLGDLRASGWEAEDVRKVEQAVVKVLAGMVDDGPEGGRRDN
jgi:hypothetical protein